MPARLLPAAQLAAVGSCAGKIPPAGKPGKRVRSAPIADVPRVPHRHGRVTVLGVARVAVAQRIHEAVAPLDLEAQRAEVVREAALLGEVRLLGDVERLEPGLGLGLAHPRLQLAVGRDRDGGQDPDDGQDDHQLDEGETAGGAGRGHGTRSRRG